MSALEVLRQAWHGLTEQALRASLSAVGIVFGVATVVAALAVGEGARQRAYDEVAVLGLSNAFVRARVSAPFTPADVAAVERRVGTQAIVGGARRSAGDVAWSRQLVRVNVAGVAARWQAIGDLHVREGRWLSPSDVLERRRVAVLTSELAAALFQGTRALGESVRWREHWFTVIGVLQPERRVDGRAAMYVPLTTADAVAGAGDDGRSAQEIAVRAAADADAEAVAQDVVRTLTTRGHRPDAFEVLVPRALLRARLAAQRTFDRVMFAVGGLALLISGIGIMNIMVASVAARTVEIGVRRAMGARRRDVIAQFITEASLLCLGGSAAGVPLGMALAAAIAAGAGWPVVISLGTVALAVGAALTVGLVCGAYPARRAALLDPVAALRD